jgi:hypothetical protein
MVEDDRFDLESVFEKMFDVIAADPTLAMRVIKDIAHLTRDHDSGDADAIEFCVGTRHFLAEDIVAAMEEREHAGKMARLDDMHALHRLGRYMLGQVDESGEDEALYVLIAGVAELIGDAICEMAATLLVTIHADDKTLIKLSLEDGRKLKLANGALDRARATMRDAGWLSWQVNGDGFLYDLTPPENWRELVEANEAAIKAADARAQ